MPGCHGIFSHGVNESPLRCHVPSQSTLPSSSSCRGWEHMYRRCALAHPGRRASFGQSQGRKTEITCSKKGATEPLPSSAKMVVYKNGGNAVRNEDGRVASSKKWNDAISTAYESDVSKLELPAPHLESPSARVHRASVDHTQFCMNEARQHRERSLRSVKIQDPPQKDELAAVRWLKNMGNVYGPSFMLLVGLGYWLQGFRCFPWFAVNFYFKDVLTVDPGTLQLVQNTVNIPMVAKPVYGIVSDAVYIRGAHRVPYLVIGGVLQALSWSTIAFLPGGGSSVSIVAILLALSNLGASMVDVANDALVAECSKMKKSTGELQSFAWLSTAAGGVLGNLIAAFALSRADFRLMFSMFGMLLACQAGKLVGVNEGSFGLRNVQTKDDNLEKMIELGKVRPVKVIPSSIMRLRNQRSAYAYAFESTDSAWRQLRVQAKRVGYYTAMNSAEQNESRLSATEVVSPDYASLNTVRPEALVAQADTGKVVGMRQQFTELMSLVKKPEIFYPLSWFMASYALIPTQAGTMFFFQTQHLSIDPSIVGMAKVMGQIGLMGGSMLYSRYLKGVPLRKLLTSVQVLLCVCMMSDILLVKRMNVDWGIPDAMLVLGASAFVDAINQFKILPFMVLLAQLCPAGSEGSLLAAFMAVQCLASIISGYMGVSLASMLHITCDDFSQLPFGIIVQSMAALLPLLWISCIPDGGNGKQEGKGM